MGLPNKIFIATENTPSHSTVGLYIDAGARYETLASSCVNHFLVYIAPYMIIGPPPL